MTRFACHYSGVQCNRGAHPIQDEELNIQCPAEVLNGFCHVHQRSLLRIGIGLNNGQDVRHCEYRIHKCKYCTLKCEYEQLSP